MTIHRLIKNQLQKKFIYWLLGLLGGGSIMMGIVAILTIVVVITNGISGHQSIEEPPIEDIPIITDEIIFPLDNFRVTCSFTCYDNHGGLDMSGGYGVEVRAVMNGIVIKVVTGYASNGGYYGHPGGYGNQVLIQHENGIQTRYAHMVDSIRVSVGDEVQIGQVIGQQGNSGNSTGSHLHFEWIENGVKVDPMTRLPFDNLSVSSGQNKPTTPPTTY